MMLAPAHSAERPDWALASDESDVLFVLTRPSPSMNDDTQPLSTTSVSDELAHHANATPATPQVEAEEESASLEASSCELTSMSISMPDLPLPCQSTGEVNKLLEILDTEMDDASPTSDIPPTSISLEPCPDEPLPVLPCTPRSRSKSTGLNPEATPWDPRKRALADVPQLGVQDATIPSHQYGVQDDNIPQSVTFGNQDLDRVPLGNSLPPITPQKAPQDDLGEALPIGTWRLEVESNPYPSPETRLHTEGPMLESIPRFASHSLPNFNRGYPGPSPRSNRVAPLPPSFYPSPHAIRNAYADGPWVGGYVFYGVQPTPLTPCTPQRPTSVHYQSIVPADSQNVEPATFNASPRGSPSNMTPIPAYSPASIYAVDPNPKIPFVISKKRSNGHGQGPSPWPAPIRGAHPSTEGRR